MRMTKDALNKQDAAFARRIARRDESVLTDVQQAYAGSLRNLLQSHRGGLLDNHDIDDVVAQAIVEVWNKFDQDRGSSLRWFLFRVAKCRLQDRLRRNSSRRNAELEAARIAGAEARREPRPDEILAEEDLCEAKARVSRVVENAVAQLTERQRKALIRRFAVGGGHHWAKHLEQGTGIPAKQCRKASDEALKRIRAHLVDHGVRFSREEGRYEVA